MRVPVWTYEVAAKRVRHPSRGYYYAAFQIIRSDGKIVATNADANLIARILERFESWARHPWS